MQTRSTPPIVLVFVKRAIGKALQERLRRDSSFRDFSLHFWDSDALRRGSRRSSAADEAESLDTFLNGSPFLQSDSANDPDSILVGVLGGSEVVKEYLLLKLREHGDVRHIRRLRCVLIYVGSGLLDRILFRHGRWMGAVLSFIALVGLAVADRVLKNTPHLVNLLGTAGSAVVGIGLLTLGTLAFDRPIKAIAEWLIERRKARATEVSETEKQLATCLVEGDISVRSTWPEPNVGIGGPGTKEHLSWCSQHSEIGWDVHGIKVPQRLARYFVRDLSERIHSLPGHKNIQLFDLMETMLMVRPGLPGEMVSLTPDLRLETYAELINYVHFSKHNRDVRPYTERYTTSGVLKGFFFRNGF